MSSARGPVDSGSPARRRRGTRRSVFYFYTMYPTQAGVLADVGDPDMLYQWHLDDPVDATEVTRNNRTEVAQGNRNPYIDHPEWVYEAWFWEPPAIVPGCMAATACNLRPRRQRGRWQLCLLGRCVRRWGTR